MHRSVASLRCTLKQFGELTKLKFSSGGTRFSKETNQEEKVLPTLIYVQNPIAWLVNKMDFRMLKTAWDSEFDEKEFKRGTSQAVSVISQAIFQNDWEILDGLVARQALRRLRREVETGWSDLVKRNIALVPEQIKLALPTRIRFSRIGEEKFVDVDAVFVGLKFEDPVTYRNLIFIESAARFHRNYSLAPFADWTVSVFKITRFEIQKGRAE